MEWLEPLRGQVIALDTAPLIYFIEEHPRYLSKIRPFFEAFEKKEFRVVTSVLTLLEVLVQPLRQNNIELAQKYRDILLNTDGLEIHPLSFDIAERAAQLRAIHNLPTPDAIQLATAQQVGASFFLTNDFALPALSEFEILILDRVI